MEQSSIQIEELTKKVAKGAGITFIGSFSGKGIGFLSQIIIATLLGAKLFGFYALGLALLNISEIFARMGLDSGAVRFISVYIGAGSKQRVKGTIFQSFAFSFLAGLGIAVVVYASSSLIATRIFKMQELSGVIKAFSLSIPFMSTLMVAVRATRGFQRTQYFVYVRHIFQPIIRISLFLLLYWVGLKLYGAIWATIISGVLALILGSLYIRRLFPEVIGNIKPVFETGKLLKFSIPLLFIDAVGFFLVWTDKLMLGYFRSASEVGVYHAVFHIASLLLVTSAALSSIFAPVIAELYDQRNMDRLNDLFKIVTKWSFYLSFPIFVLMVFFPDEILNLLGREFLQGGNALFILAFAMFVSAGTGNIRWVLAMCDRQVLWAYTMSVAALLNLSLNFWLIPKFGIVGASIATGLSIIGMHLAGLIETRYVLKLFPFHKSYLKGLAAGSITCIAAFTIKNLKVVNQRSLFSLFFIAFFVVGVYIFMLVVFQLDKEDRMILSTIKRKVMAFLTGGGHGG